MLFFRLFYSTLSKDMNVLIISSSSIQKRKISCSIKVTKQSSKISRSISTERRRRAKIQKRKIYRSIEWTRIFFHIPNSAYMSDYTGTTTPRLVACDACLVPAGDRRLESACALCRRCPARLLPRADLFTSRLRPA